MLATGGSDAVINLWHDSTAAEKEEAFRKEVSQSHLLIGNLNDLLVFSIMKNHTRRMLLASNGLPILDSTMAYGIIILLN